MLAPYYKEGVEMMHADIRKLTRLVVPDPMPEEAIGSSDMAKASRCQLLLLLLSLLLLF